MDQESQVFTFGMGHPLFKNHYIVIRADTKEECRNIMQSTFGSKWAFQYDTKEDAGVDRWDMKEVNHGD